MGVFPHSSQQIRRPPPKSKMMMPFLLATFRKIISTVVRCLQGLYGWLVSWYGRATGSGVLLRLDTGIQVRIGRLLAEGGFSWVYEAVSVNPPYTCYALKRLACGTDPELVQAACQEAALHRAVHHPYLMPLLGLTWTTHDGQPPPPPSSSSSSSQLYHNNKPLSESFCYLLFPYYSRSLREMVNQRVWKRMTGEDRAAFRDPMACPWDSETQVLQLFLDILRAVQAFHQQTQHAHLDIKLENILLAEDHTNSSPTVRPPSAAPNPRLHPVLMDFGSAGPLTVELDSRRTVMDWMERASQHTTLAYRPPELFEGGVRHGDPDLDLTRVDVWSCGCTLFALLYGVSPFEGEFGRDGRLHVVECTHLSVLGNVPRPPDGSPVAQWYSPDLLDLVDYILTHDRRQRPTVQQVQERVQALLIQRGSSPLPPPATTAEEEDDSDGALEDGIALLPTHRHIV